jgi:hypothetical protein
LRTDLITTSRIQEEIAAWVQAGHELDEIEARLIEPAPVGDESRAALWLYAWALRDGGTGASRPRTRRFARSSGQATPRPKLDTSPARPRTRELIAVP